MRGQSGERLEFRSEMVQRGAGKLQVDPIVRLDLLPLGIGQFPIGRIGEFLEPSGPEIGANRFERREVAGLPRPGGQVDMVSLDRGPRPRPIAQTRRIPGPSYSTRLVEIG